ncbi:beta-galactosidase [Actinophytocola sp.]|uniref:beta-galactosidase n=1 Tax=Actinophytocola sp. TaxID=1872138 RepID=UPI003899F9F2
MRTRMALVSAAVALALAPVPAAATASPHVGHASHTITYDRYSLMIDGHREWLWSAEFHYFRLPSQALWRDQLEKLDVPISGTSRSTASVYLRCCTDHFSPERFTRSPSEIATAMSDLPRLPAAILRRVWPRSRR